MAEIKRSTLFGKLNPIAYKALEGATIFCKLRGNPYVELVHWIYQLLQLPDSDLHRIFKHFGIDASKLPADLLGEGAAHCEPLELGAEGGSVPVPRVVLERAGG